MLNNLLSVWKDFVLSVSGFNACKYTVLFYTTAPARNQQAIILNSGISTSFLVLLYKLTGLSFS